MIEASVAVMSGDAAEVLLQFAMVLNRCAGVLLATATVLGDLAEVLF